MSTASSTSGDFDLPTDLLAVSTRHLVGLIDAERLAEHHGAVDGTRQPEPESSHCCTSSFTDQTVFDMYIIEVSEVLHLLVKHPLAETLWALWLLLLLLLLLLLALLQLLLLPFQHQPSCCT